MKMKKVLLAAFIVIGSLSFQQKAAAQVGVSINIGSQPAWGPTGYNYVQYYYFPDINCYYSVQTGQYIYLSGSKWRFSKSLPQRYSSYNPYNMYKVVVNRSTPYMTNSQDVAQYGRYKGQRSQPVIRDSKDPTYYQNPGNSNYSQWKSQQQKQKQKGRGR
jgi:hypothetical protein